MHWRVGWIRLGGVLPHAGNHLRISTCFQMSAEVISVMIYVKIKWQSALECKLIAE